MSGFFAQRRNHLKVIPHVEDLSAVLTHAATHGSNRFQRSTYNTSTSTDSALIPG
jgi:hypothetical protein